MNSIELAMEGRAEMNNPSLVKEKHGRQHAASKFRAFARDHNIRWAKRNG